MAKNKSNRHPHHRPVERPARRQNRIGQVVSTRMNKTIVVKVTRRVVHPLYKRVIEQKRKFYAHDEHNQCRPGDWVRIEETRPLSKLKRWRLAEILKRVQT